MKSSNFFWVSFSDLMTSLFFIMMVLFAVTIGYLQYQKKATEQQLKKLEEIQTAVQQLPLEYFSYQEKYKRFKLNKEIEFVTGSAAIDTNYNKDLLKVGASIQKLVNSLHSNEKYKDFDIKYQIVIEGMASKDTYPFNFELSYKRSLSLYRLWKENGITFDPQICEIQISGSGTDGVREYSGTEERKNQQFLIQIIPKIGKIDFKK
ncbi:OmpA family protein [Aequorivita viscosa]|nr:OmpA family protein [Aequorivita viscosa]